MEKALRMRIARIFGEEELADGHTRVAMDGFSIIESVASRDSDYEATTGGPVKVERWSREKIDAMFPRSSRLGRAG